MSDRVDVARLRALLDAATPGRWYAEDGLFGWSVWSETGGRDGGACEVLAGSWMDEAECRAIAEMRNALPALLDVVEAGLRTCSDLAHDDCDCGACKLARALDRFDPGAGQ